jgi:hypothetical protein
MYIMGLSHAQGCPEGTEVEHFVRHAAQFGIVDLGETPEDKEAMVEAVVNVLSEVKFGLELLTELNQ